MALSGCNNRMRTLAQRRGPGTLTAGILALALSLGACADGTGFRPMYGSLGSGATTDQKLAEIEVATIPGRVGQRVRNEFIYHSTGGGAQAKPKYRLDIIISETVTSTLQLVRLSDSVVVMKGTSYSRAGFERFTSIFSNVRAREDAENRAARVIGDDLKTRMAAFLASEA
jgi:LPS-assembly lipoprotein